MIIKIWQTCSSLAKMLTVLTAEQLSANIFDESMIIEIFVTGGCELSPFYRVLHCKVFLHLPFRWISFSLHKV